MVRARTIIGNIIGGSERMWVEIELLEEICRKKGVRIFCEVTLVYGIVIMKVLIKENFKRKTDIRSSSSHGNKLQERDKIIVFSFISPLLFQKASLPIFSNHWFQWQ